METESENTGERIQKSPFVKFGTFCFESPNDEALRRMFRVTAVVPVSFGIYRFLARVTKAHAIQAPGLKEWFSVTTIPVASECCGDLLLPREVSSERVNDGVVGGECCVCGKVWDINEKQVCAGA